MYMTTFALTDEPGEMRVEINAERLRPFSIIFGPPRAQTLVSLTAEEVRKMSYELESAIREFMDMEHPSSD